MKKSMKLLLVFTLITVLFTSAFLFAQGNVKIMVNGKPAAFNGNALIVSGNTLVPLNFFENLGASTKWDRATNTAWVENKYTRIEFKLNSKTVYIHHNFDFTGIPEKVALKVAPKMINKVVYIPLRVTVEGLGAQCQWDGKKNTINITTDDQIAPVEKPANYEKVTANTLDENKDLKQWYDSIQVKQGIQYKTIGGITYVFLGAGEKPTGGYTVEITSATQIAEGHVYITAKVISPSPDMLVTQVITYPNLLIKLDQKGIQQVTGTIE